MPAFTQGEGFGERADNCVARHIVDELGHRCAADRAHIGGPIPDRVEYGLVLVEGLFVAANLDREFAGCRAGRTAAHGGIEHVQTFFGKGRVQLLHDARRIC
jgi:hypothetical protein